MSNDSHAAVDAPCPDAPDRPASAAGNSDVRALLHRKEQEVLQLRLQALQDLRHERDNSEGKRLQLQQQFNELQADFKHNLALLAERDAELERLDATVAHLSLSLNERTHLQERLDQRLADMRADLDATAQREADLLLQLEAEQAQGTVLAQQVAASEQQAQRAVQQAAQEAGQQLERQRVEAAAAIMAQAQQLEEAWRGRVEEAQRRAQAAEHLAAQRAAEANAAHTRELQQIERAEAALAATREAHVVAKAQRIELDASLQRGTEELAAARGEAAALRRQLQEVSEQGQGQVAALLEELGDVRRQHSEAHRQWQRRLDRAIEQHESEMATARQRLEHALGRLNQMQDAATSHAAAAQAVESNLLEQLQAAQDERTALTDSLPTLLAEACASTKQELLVAQEQLWAAQEEAKLLKSRLAVAKQSLDRRHADEEALQAQLAAAAARERELQRCLTQATLHLEALHEEVGRLRTTPNFEASAAQPTAAAAPPTDPALAELVLSLTRERDAATSSAAQLQHQLAAQQDRLEVLQQQQLQQQQQRQPLTAGRAWQQDAASGRAATPRSLSLPPELPASLDSGASFWLAGGASPHSAPPGMPAPVGALSPGSGCSSAQGTHNAVPPSWQPGIADLAVRQDIQPPCSGLVPVHGNSQVEGNGIGGGSAGCTPGMLAETMRVPMAAADLQNVQLRSIIAAMRQEMEAMQQLQLQLQLQPPHAHPDAGDALAPPAAPEALLLRAELAASDAELSHALQHVSVLQSQMQQAQGGSHGATQELEYLRQRALVLMAENRRLRRVMAQVRLEAAGAVQPLLAYNVGGAGGEGALLAPLRAVTDAAAQTQWGLSPLEEELQREVAALHTQLDEQQLLAEAARQEALHLQLQLDAQASTADAAAADARAARQRVSTLEVESERVMELSNALRAERDHLLRQLQGAWDAVTAAAATAAPATARVTWWPPAAPLQQPVSPSPHVWDDVAARAAAPSGVAPHPGLGSAQPAELVVLALQPLPSSSGRRSEPGQGQEGSAEAMADQDAGWTPEVHASGGVERLLRLTSSAKRQADQQQQPPIVTARETASQKARLHARQRRRALLGDAPGVVPVSRPRVRNYAIAEDEEGAIADTTGGV